MSTTHAVQAMVVINAVGFTLAYLITRRSARHRRELARAELEMIRELRMTMHDLRYSSPEIEETLEVGLLELDGTEHRIRKIAERPLWML